MWNSRMLRWSLITIWLSGCTLSFNIGVTPHTTHEVWDDGIYHDGRYEDGVYTGTHPLPTPQLFVVDVTIETGRIVSIHIREHPMWSTLEDQEPLLRTVLTDQTTATYTPRHEGSKQDHLLDAIEDALNKAQQSRPAMPE